MSNGYSKIIVVGNLGGDPEMRFLPDGTPVTNFSVAVNHVWNKPDGSKGERTDWFRVTAWRGLAEVCNQYLTKGRQVLIEAEQIKASAYTNNQGQPAASLEMTAVRVVFLGNGQGQGEAHIDDGAPAVEPEATPF